MHSCRMAPSRAALLTGDPMSTEPETPTVEVLPPIPIAAQPLPAPAPAPGKRPVTKVGPKTEKALLALVSGEAQTITKAAELGGMTREQFSRNLKLPHVMARLDEMRKQTLGTRGAMAEAKLASLTGSARSEYVQLEAAKALLNHESTVKGLGGPAGGVTIKIDLG